MEMLDLLCGTLFGSPLVSNYGNIICKQDFVPAGFALDLGLKDVQLFLAAGERFRVPSPLGSVLRDRFLASLAYFGTPAPDWAAITQTIRRDAGLAPTRARDGAK